MHVTSLPTHCYLTPFLICSATSLFPAGDQIQSYIASLPQEAPLNFAVVDGGDVSMFYVAQGHIPDLVHMQQTGGDSVPKDGGGPSGSSQYP